MGSDDLLDCLERIIFIVPSRVTTINMVTSPTGPGRPTLHILAILLILVSSAWSDPEAIHVASGGLAELPSGPLSTKTVLGFLDFITTVSDTVTKFTSQGGPGNTPAYNPVQSSAFLGSDFNSNNQESPSSFIEVNRTSTNQLKATKSSHRLSKRRRL